jgi:rRNA-processing protein FCF1
VKARHPGGIYCLDADALINIWMYYPAALKLLNRQAKEGRVVITEGVRREIYKKSDHLKKMVQSWQKNFDAVIEIETHQLQTELARLENAYGQDIYIGKRRRDGFWASKRGRQAADSQVVAVCKVNKYICVSNDQAIQSVCHLENVPSIGWQEFYRRMKHGLTGQEMLFE